MSSPLDSKEKLVGLKAIKDILERVWERHVDLSSIVNYRKRLRDPLPYDSRGGRVIADLDAVLRWAARN